MMTRTALQHLLGLAARVVSAVRDGSVGRSDKGAVVRGRARHHGATGKERSKQQDHRHYGHYDATTKLHEQISL
jgi:hypothetical protein